MNDDDTVLEHLLRIVSGLPLLQLDSCDLVERVLHAAEGYEMPGAVSILRLAITGPLLASDDPIHMYGICARYGWEEEAKLLSTRTLAFNIYDGKHRGSLERLSSQALWRLYAFHRSRREQYVVFPISLAWIGADGCLLASVNAWMTLHSSRASLPYVRSVLA